MKRTWLLYNKLPSVLSGAQHFRSEVPMHTVQAPWDFMLSSRFSTIRQTMLSWVAFPMNEVFHLLKIETSTLQMAFRTLMILILFSNTLILIYQKFNNDLYFPTHPPPLLGQMQLQMNKIVNRKWSWDRVGGRTSGRAGSPRRWVGGSAEKRFGKSCCETRKPSQQPKDC